MLKMLTVATHSECQHARPRCRCSDRHAHCCITPRSRAHMRTRHSPPAFDAARPGPVRHAPNLAPNPNPAATVIPREAHAAHRAHQACLLKHNHMTRSAQLALGLA